MTIIEAIAHESKLAEEGEGYHKQLADWLVQLLKVQTDNDRLRELVTDLWNLTEFGYAEKYELHYVDALSLGEMYQDHVEQRMQELGVDV